MILALRVIVLTLLVTACTTAPPRSALPVAELPETWLAQGRLAVKSGDEAWHGTFAWHQAPTLLQIELAGPLGQGSVRLHEDPDGARLELGTEQVIHGVDSGALLREQLGWAMPVQGLRYWIRGLPEPAAGKVQATRDEAGRLRRLEQSGWSIEYQRYQVVGEIYLPAKLRLIHDDITVRIVVDQWEPGDIAVRLP